MSRHIVRCWLVVLAYALALDFSECYYKPSMKVGERLASQYSRFDRRYPFEFGLGHYYQGDILLKPQEGRVVIRDTANRWPNGVVPYKLAGNFSFMEKSVIKSAINQYTMKTCVRFVENSNQTYFVTIWNNNTGCYSYVGFHEDNTFHQMNLQSPYCTDQVGTAVHELLHALGSFHEFNRPDRDEWVTVNRSALQPAYQQKEFYESNFGVLPNDHVLMYNIPYNYGSVMHYSKWAGAASPNYPVFSNNKAWFGDFGSPTGLKQSDVDMVNTMYCGRKG